MDLENIKAGIVTNVYHIPADRKVPLHQHAGSDEIFYCIAGDGFGVLENFETPLSTGQAFIVPAGKMHALKTNNNLYVCSFLIPKLEQES